MERNDDPKRIARLVELDKIATNIRKRNKKLNPPKMIRLCKDIPNEELFKHVEIISLIAGEGYKMTAEHENTITGLIYYFNGLQDKAKQFGFDISKGIGITGTWGVGKTTIFGAFHEYLSIMCGLQYNPNTFRITSMDEIADLMYRGEKDAVTSLFLLNTVQEADGSLKSNPIHICINEFGKRYDIKNYGTDVNELVDTFLKIRYDIFVKYGKVTHMTTNYGAKDLEKIFTPVDQPKPDQTLPDRFKQMFDLKNLKGESFRK